MNEPTEQEINRAIAEWMGWTVRHTHVGPIDFTVLVDPSGKATDSTSGHHPIGVGLPVPSYTTSHDACHQALERMGSVNRDKVLSVLYGNHDDTQLVRAIVRESVLCATAHQKALAIYRVVKGEGR